MDLDQIRVQLSKVIDAEEAAYLWHLRLNSKDEEAVKAWQSVLESMKRDIKISILLDEHLEYKSNQSIRETKQDK